MLHSRWLPWVLLAAAVAALVPLAFLPMNETVRPVLKASLNVVSALLFLLGLAAFWWVDPRTPHR